MRHFTVSEANAALEVVRPLAERLVECRRELAELGEELAQVRQTVSGNGGGLDVARVERLRRRFEQGTERARQCVEEIHVLGAQVKDLDLGLVDFPARHPGDGRTVLLCWRVGEEAIRYWHGLEEGFAGRKTLPF
jgi:hypothetical protein